MEERVGFRRVEIGERGQKGPPGEGKLMHKCREVGKVFCEQQAVEFGRSMR